MPRRPQPTHSAVLWSLGQTDPVRRPLPLTESHLILQFTAGWACAGGPRAPSGSSLWDCSGAARSRCERIFAMSCSSSMLAMIFSSPPQRVQLSISTPNTRFSRLAQLIATCRGVDGLVGSAPDTGGVAAPRPRCAGVTADRY